MLPLRSKLLLALLIPTWVGIIVHCQAWLLGYGLAPGEVHRPASIIHKDGKLASGRESRPRLILALHPRCPCSRATLSELEKILSERPGVGEVTILMYKPALESDEWMSGSIWERCRAIECRIVVDTDGRIAGSLGCQTSGSVVVYDAEGRLRYYGGITAGRGHEGDNPGARAVKDIFAGLQVEAESMPVFGCRI